MTYADVREIYEKAKNAGILYNAEDFARLTDIKLSYIQRMLTVEEGNLGRDTRYKMSHFTALNAPSLNGVTIRQTNEDKQWAEYRKETARMVLVTMLRGDRGNYPDGSRKLDVDLAGEAVSMTDALIKELKGIM